MSAAEASTRRTQAERTASMRGALADATIELLIERGWAAVTVVEVCNRAGVTRGAFHHHYDSLPELLADALRRLYALSSERPTKVPTDVRGLVEVTWTAIGNPRFKAVLEAWLAMANDPSLREQIGPVVAEFAAVVKPEAITTILTSRERRELYLTARETMLGLALGRATNGGEPLGHERTILARLRAEADAIDAAGP
jgi:AcrR family transcriptional regulator